MAVLFDHLVLGKENGEDSGIRWHQMHPLLAVLHVTNNFGSIRIFQDLDELLSPLSINYSVTSFAWHPTRKVLACGCNNGDIVIVDIDNNNQNVSSGGHDSGVTLLCWNSDGSNLFAGHSGGGMLIWRFSSDVNLLATAVSFPVANELLNNVIVASVSSGSNISSCQSTHFKEQKCFFVGGQKGGIYLVNAENSREIFTVDSPVKMMLFYEKKDILLILNTNLTFVLCHVKLSGQAEEIRKLKLTGTPGRADMIWVGSDLLAICTGENLIKMWDFDKDEICVLKSNSDTKTDLFTCIEYNAMKGLLAGRLLSGKVIIWSESDGDLASRWHIKAKITLSSPICSVQFDLCTSLLAVDTRKGVFTVDIREPCTGFAEGVAVVQTGATQLAVDFLYNKSHTTLTTDILIYSVHVTENYLVVHDGLKFVVFEIISSIAARESSSFVVVGSFNSCAQHACVYNKNIYTFEPVKNVVRNLQGIVKQILEVEGNVVSANICSDFLAIATNTGAISIYDLSRREAKIFAGPKYFQFQTLCGIDMVKCNSLGSKVSISVKKSGTDMDSKLFIWDVDLDKLQTFDFSNGKWNISSESVECCQFFYSNQTAKAQQLIGRHPISHFWDLEEPRLLVCETKHLFDEPANSNGGAFSPQSSASCRPLVVSFFCSSDYGIFIRNSFSVEEDCSQLLASKIPRYYFMKKICHQTSSHESIIPTNCFENVVTACKWHHDFIGILDYNDKSIKQAMMDFSFFTTIFDVNQALNAIRIVDSESIWENLAKVSLYCRRIDVARICLGKMSSARGAVMLRRAMKEPEEDVQYAMLAVHFGDFDEAEVLLKNCNRFDLLNEIHQCRGNWDKALDVATTQDQMHFRTTYYNYAKYLENEGRHKEAVSCFEKSGTRAFEVLRNLYGNLVEAEDYLRKTRDKSLLKWWADYMDSMGLNEKAIEYYKLADDCVSLVRLFCKSGNTDEALKICDGAGNKAACYVMAQVLENGRNFEKAVEYYARARDYGDAVRLCKEKHFNEKLINFAILGDREVLLDAARYYENIPEFQDKAICLYHKAGKLSDAFELAYNNKQFSALEVISDSFDQTTDPSVMKRCADYFIKYSQYDRAVKLLAIAKQCESSIIILQYKDALEICKKWHVPMTAELVEMLTPTSEPDEAGTSERSKILEELAEVCFEQRQYHLATKKFTQAKNGVKAMKVLLKSGDTEKIIRFANVSRQKDLYIMAANYLQSLEWQKDSEIMRNIISFYTKGKELAALAGFYDVCAQVEIDDFHNHEKALEAMAEAYKCLNSIQSSELDVVRTKMMDLKSRMALIHKYISAKCSYVQNGDEAMEICESLLTETDCERAVRTANIYGLMIEHYVSVGKWKQVENCMSYMLACTPQNKLDMYISTETLKKLQKGKKVFPNENVAKVGSKKEECSAKGCGDSLEKTLKTENKK